jgi:hypothetical protein
MNCELTFSEAVRATGNCNFHFEVSCHAPRPIGRVAWRILQKGVAALQSGVSAARLSFFCFKSRRVFMQEKCACQNCQGNIEFAREEFDEMGRSGDRIMGQYVECPHCKKETVLSISRPLYPAAIITPEVAPNKSTPPPIENKSIVASESSKIEDRLEIAAFFVIFVGIVSAVFGFVCYEQSQQTVWAVVGIAALFQSWIFCLFLSGFAEIIRLLRKRT